MEMSTERYYDPSPCEGKTKLPVDVQVYHSNYRVCIPEICTYESENIAIKGLSSNNAPEPYTWERDIYPIFRQYYHLYPVMRHIVNLSDYDSVTMYQNLNLLSYAMNLSITNPNYMPVTRDISLSNQQMILEWLDNPIKNVTHMSFTNPDFGVDIYDSPEVVPFPNCSTASGERDFGVPNYCDGDSIRFNNCDHFEFIRDSQDNSATNCTRPLFEIGDCIKTLGDGIFKPESEELQVKWPWPLQKKSQVGQLHIVTNVSMAIYGINEIIEQGEGTDPLHPDDLVAGQLAHYYRFQEIVCGKKLVNVSKDKYAYSGDNIREYGSTLHVGMARKKMVAIHLNCK